MIDLVNKFPSAYHHIVSETERLGFSMASDVQTGSLLKTLAATKPSGRFLELGTGTGLSTSWILDGMDQESFLTSIDHDVIFLQIAKNSLGSDKRLKIVLADGEQWLLANLELKFDFIFADTWHGKYLLLTETLNMLNKGGIYFIDDMLPQPNWPEGHDKKAEKLISDLENRADLVLTKLKWSTGIIIATKI